MYNSSAIFGHIGGQAAFISRNRTLPYIYLVHGVQEIAMNIG